MLNNRLTLPALQAALQRGIRFCLSDDSHGVAHIAHGYAEALEFLSDCGVRELHYIRHDDNILSTVDQRFPSLQIRKINLEEITSRPPGPDGELIDA